MRQRSIAEIEFLAHFFFENEYNTESVAFWPTFYDIHAQLHTGIMIGSDSQNMIMKIFLGLR